VREDFDELRIPSEIVDRFPPDRFALFDLLRRQIPDSLLKSIAQADYGHDVREHVEALKRSHDPRPVPSPVIQAWKGHALPK